MSALFQENGRGLSANESGSIHDGEKGLKRRDVQGSKEGNTDESCDIKEDIYGRLVDRKTGEVVSKGADVRQRLVDLEKGSCPNQSEERKKLEKNLRGTINRLNENTIVSSVKSVGDMFASYAHNGMSDVFDD